MELTNLNHKVQLREEHEEHLWRVMKKKKTTTFLHHKLRQVIMHALRTALSDLFSSSSEGSENEQEDHASTGEVSNGGDDELAGITAATKIDSRRMPARVVGHIKHLRQVRDYAKKQDRLLAKLEKKHARNRERRAAELRKVRTFNLSITLEWQGHHVPTSVFYSFKRWLAQRSEWWAVAYEHGPTCGFWHLQSAAIIDDISIQAIKTSWHAFVGWDAQRPPVRKVNLCMKELSGKGLHTQVGMLGYTRKDLDKYEGHLWACAPAVTEDECSEADLVYVQFGKGDKGQSCVLTEANLIDRARGMRSASWTTTCRGFQREAWQL